MASLKIKDIVDTMTNKGFIKVDGRKHYHLVYMYQGKKTSIKTVYSRSDKEIGDYLIGKMAQQTKLKNDQFIRLIDCALSKQDYFNIVISHIK